MPPQVGTFNPLAEIVGMPAADLTDAVLIDLHVRQLRASGLSHDLERGRRGALARVGAYLDPHHENRRALVEAEPSDLASWQANLRIAPKSVRCYVSHVQLWYAWLVRPMRVLTESPAVDLVKPAVPKRLPRPIPEEDLAYALDACTDRMVYAWMVLGAYAGLRSVDIQALRTDDLLLGGDVPFLRVRGKGGDEKLVAVGMEVIQVIAPFQGRKGPLFAGPDGTFVRRQVIQLTVNTYLAGIGLAYTFHQFRHRYGTKVYELTRDIRYTQQQMRHDSVTSTEIYTLTMQDRGSSALEFFDADLSRRRQQKGGRS
jgi:integrase